MAQRKPPSGGKPAAKKGTSRPAGKPGAASTGKVSTSKVSTGKVSTSKVSTSKVSTSKASAASTAARAKPASRKPGKSIVNQKQTPWGLIASVIAVVLFAAAVIVVVIVTHKSNSAAGGNCGSANAAYCRPELTAAKQIPGVIYKVETNHTHVSGTVHYDTTPPIGGNHSPYWADCDGTVYPKAIANENAVHALEHGAVWVTYQEGLPANEVSTLAKDITGQQKVFMSPYPGLKTKVSLQAWNYQLFVNNVTDPRIVRFIAALANNDAITPELTTCSDPSFKANPSAFGHPLSAPAAGGAVTMPASSAP